LVGVADGLQAVGRLEEAIAHYQRVLALAPAHAVAANNMGNALQVLGRFDEATACYRTALETKPDSPEIRTNLGRALDSAGHPREALAEFGRALALAPASAEIHYRVGSILENIPFLEDARAYYQMALRLQPDYAAAHVALGNVLADLGLEDAAWEHRRLGYADDVLVTRPALGNDHPIRVLKLMSAAGGNVPLDTVLTPTRYEVSRLIAEYADQLPSLDRFDIVFNAIGDADRCARGLDAAEALLADCSLPVLNPPARVRRTTRAATSARLGSLPGVRTPRLVTWPRSMFETGQAAASLAAKGWTCPLLLRVLGHHTGHHFVKVDAFDQVNAAGLSLPGNQITVIEWLNAESADGTYRKYRVLFLGGEIYPLHMAVSEQWKVHYFTANMADDEAYRLEERRFLADYPAVLGAQGTAAVQAIRDALQLDYGGLDFAIGPAGEILVFEANATMHIILPHAEPLWDYRRPFVEQALRAAQGLFQPRRAGEDLP
jgi:hypothetical protein